MNLLNQREDLRLCYEADIITASMLKQALESPVFIIANTRVKLTPDEIEWVGQHVMHDEHSSKGGFPRIVPFPCFRLVLKDYPLYMQWWFNMKEDTGICLVCDSEKNRETTKLQGITHFRFFFDRDNPSVKSRPYYEHKPINMADMSPQDDKDAQVAIQATLDRTSRRLAEFLFDVMSNTSTIVKVTDDQPGRSVQWRLNREHYLVLNRHQAQTMQKHRRGVSDKDLIRGAHWRRAHLRRLNSEKFKHKKGLLVPVKKAWVGPDEWKGHDGKIYKVTEIHK